MWTCSNQSENEDIICDMQRTSSDIEIRLTEFSRFLPLIPQCLRLGNLVSITAWWRVIQEGRKHHLTIIYVLWRGCGTTADLTTFLLSYHTLWCHQFSNRSFPHYWIDIVIFTHAASTFAMRKLCYNESEWINIGWRPAAMIKIYARHTNSHRSSRDGRLRGALTFGKNRRRKMKHQTSISYSL